MCSYHAPCRNYTWYRNNCLNCIYVCEQGQHPRQRRGFTVSGACAPTRLVQTEQCYFYPTVNVHQIKIARLCGTISHEVRGAVYLVLIHYKAFRVACGSARYARSQGRMERNDRCIGMWSYILGAKGRLVNAQSSMLQENNPDATCMYVYTKYKVPLREVARGVAQERNEKHPA